MIPHQVIAEVKAALFERNCLRRHPCLKLVLEHLYRKGKHDKKNPTRPLRARSAGNYLWRLVLIPNTATRYGGCARVLFRQAPACTMRAYRIQPHEAEAKGWLPSARLGGTHKPALQQYTKIFKKKRAPKCSTSSTVHRQLEYGGTALRPPAGAIQTMR